MKTYTILIVLIMAFSGQALAESVWESRAIAASQKAATQEERERANLRINSIRLAEGNESLEIMPPQEPLWTSRDIARGEPAESVYVPPVHSFPTSYPVVAYPNPVFIQQPVQFVRQPVQFVQPPVQRNVAVSVQISESPLDTIERVAALYPPPLQQQESNAEITQEESTPVNVTVKMPAQEPQEARIILETEHAKTDAQLPATLTQEQKDLINNLVAQQLAAEREQIQAEAEQVKIREDAIQRRHTQRMVMFSIAGTLVFALLWGWSGRKCLIIFRDILHEWKHGNIS